MKLGPRQRLFVHEYLIDSNATRAAIRAGYSKKSAHVNGPRLLTNARVAVAIARGQKKREQKTEITIDRIERELALIGFSDIKNYTEVEADTGAIRIKGFEQMPPGASRALESIEENRTIRESADGKESMIVCDKIKYKLWDKPKALELLGRQRGMFPTNIKGALALRVKMSMADLNKSMKESENGS